MKVSSGEGLSAALRDDLLGSDEWVLRADSAPSLATPVGPASPPIEASKAAVCYVRNSSILFQNALTKVLQEGRIAGAGLDVLEQEPGMSTIPFSSSTTSSCRRTPVLDGSMFCGNGAADVKAVLDVQHGRNPRGVVNRQVFDMNLWKARLDTFGRRFGD
jgi:D-3-phosphoglycerate dehydrogenase